MLCQLYVGKIGNLIEFWLQKRDKPGAESSVQAIKKAFYCLWCVVRVRLEDDRTQGAAHHLRFSAARTVVTAGKFGRGFGIGKRERRF